jgi:hypothetical protein
VESNFGFVQRVLIHLQVYLKPCDRLIGAHDLPQGAQEGSGRVSTLVSATKGEILQEEILVIYEYTLVCGTELTLHKSLGAIDQDLILVLSLHLTFQPRKTVSILCFCQNTSR